MTDLHLRCLALCRTSPHPPPENHGGGGGACEGTRTRTGELAGGGGSGEVGGEQREGQERIGVQKEKEGEE